MQDKTMLHWRALSRRKFLGTMAGALAPAVLPGAELQRNRPRQVIVIGAGLAGLATAYELDKLGHEVTVVEAQSRPGGRVRTERAAFANGLYAEWGAARIPSSHAWTHRYIEEFGLKLKPFYPEDGQFCTFARGRRVAHGKGGEPDLSRFRLGFADRDCEKGLGNLIERAFGDLIEAVHKGEPWPPAELLEHDTGTLADFLRERGISPDLTEVMGLGAASEYPAADLINVIANGHGQRELTRIEGGNDLLPRAFARRLREKIRYGAPVVRMGEGPRKAWVVHRQRGSLRTLEADHVVCAVPLPLLRQIGGVERLSPGKREAIQQIEQIGLSRISFQVRKRFWQEGGWNGFALTDIPGEIWHPTFDVGGERGVMQTYLFGAASKRAEALPEQARHEYAMRETCRVFPGLEEHVEGVSSYCWNNDPWARGAARMMAPGQMRELFPFVAGREGRFHFAGENTSRWNAWMNGALESGNRVVREIVEG